MMRTRKQLIDQTVKQQGRGEYSAVVRTEMKKRLTESLYLTCEDFDHFDVVCCDTCHNFYPHYDMWIVLLSDGRHAWVCDTTKHILMRETKFIADSPEMAEKMRLLNEIFGGAEDDPVEDELHAKSVAATSDEERLYYCLQFAHHRYKRKRGNETVSTLVSRALRLPGRGPAQSARIA